MCTTLKKIATNTSRRKLPLPAVYIISLLMIASRQYNYYRIFQAMLSLLFTTDCGNEVSLKTMGTRYFWSTLEHLSSWSKKSKRHLNIYYYYVMIWRWSFASDSLRPCPTEFLELPMFTIDCQLGNVRLGDDADAKEVVNKLSKTLRGINLKIVGIVRLYCY